MTHVEPHTVELHWPDDPLYGGHQPDGVGAHNGPWVLVGSHSEPGAFIMVRVAEDLTTKITTFATATLALADLLTARLDGYKCLHADVHWLHRRIAEEEGHD